MTVLIFANGELEKGEWIRPYLAQATAVIAADGGSRHLRRVNHRPDVVIGDMDSLTDEIEEWLADNHARSIRHQREKDETDLELALLFAVENYPDDIFVFGALGGRLDQTLANMLLLAHPRLDGRRVTIYSRYQRAWLITGKVEIMGEVGDLISLIPLAGEVRVATTSGLKWPLTGDILTFGPARGISNVLTAVPAVITLASGRLFCVHTAQSWQR